MIRRANPFPQYDRSILSVKFMGVVIVGNIVALLMLLIPGVNIIAFFVVNGYLLGREFFEFAAMRFRPEMEAKALRSKHSTTVFLAGLIIAAFMAIPILNLLTPLFAAAMMVHLHKAVTRVRTTGGSGLENLWRQRDQRRRNLRGLFCRLADIGNNAGGAIRFAGLADVSPMQD